MFISFTPAQKSDSIDKSDWLVTEGALPAAGFRDPRDPVCRESLHVCGAGLEPFDNGVAFPPLTSRLPSAEWVVGPLLQSHFADGDVKAPSAIPGTHSGTRIHSLHSLALSQAPKAAKPSGGGTPGPCQFLSCSENECVPFLWWWGQVGKKALGPSGWSEGEASLEGSSLSGRVSSPLGRW